MAVLTGLMPAAFAQEPTSIRATYQAPDAAQKPLAVLPFDFDDNQILVQVTLNEHAVPFRFALDSGSTMSVIDRDVAQQLGLRLRDFSPFSVLGIKVRVPLRASGYGDKGYKLQSAEHVRVQLPAAIHVPFDQSTYIVTALPKLRSGRTLDGLLGYDFLSRYVVAIDYLKKTVTLYDRKTYRYTGNGQKIPLDVRSKQAFLPVTVKPMGAEPFTAKLVLDTGNAGTAVFNTHLVDRRQILATTSTFPFTKTGPAGNISGRTGRLELIQLGAYNLTRFPAGFFQSKGGEAGNKRYDGGLGNGVLSRFDVVLDLSAHNLFLSPNGDYNKPAEPIVYSGLSSNVVADGFEIFAVDTESPAALAGFLPGDILIAVDGVSLMGLSLKEYTARFKNAGKHRYTVRRVGKDVVLEMQSRAL